LDRLIATALINTFVWFINLNSLNKNEILLGQKRLQEGIQKKLHCSLHIQSHTGP